METSTVTPSFVTVPDKPERTRFGSRWFIIASEPTVIYSDEDGRRKICNFLYASLDEAETLLHSCRSKPSFSAGLTE
jgi:hypothetical protein